MYIDAMWQDIRHPTPGNLFLHGILGAVVRVTHRAGKKGENIYA
jgi:hypothetical protein